VRLGVWAIVLAMLAAGSPLVARGQYLTRPTLPWRTIRTAHFDIHYPSEMAVWVEHVAARIESQADAVNQLVGNRPTARVTVMVEDPSNVANGFALPFLEGPVIFLWPTPPTTALSFDEFSDWGELLAIHEYGHIAHLTFPSRNARERFLWRLLPTRIGPVARRSPPWVFEGYATYIEGKLTGSGRPNGGGRAAIIRQWAREGRLPTYVALNSTAPFLGGAMRYLVGSAFLEWLVERKGEESLNHLWRRMSARVARSFPVAFMGVYGAPPDDLYGRFVAEATAKAMEIERQVGSAGLVEGELFQKLSWYTGEPAVSSRGNLLAVTLRSPVAPSRLVIMRTTTDPRTDSIRAIARRRLLERDSLDVPAIDSFPIPRGAIATLLPENGRGHDHPRFFADSSRVLVSRDEPVGDGSSRPDLFIWDWRRGDVTRVTHGAGIRTADPSPDGRRAVATRCASGICDLVLVDLTNGAITTLAAGSPTVTWTRPRWSPNGQQVAASFHRDARWQIAVVDASPAAVAANANGGPRLPAQNDVERHSPEWLDDSTLVVVSEKGGIANLERVGLLTSEVQPITRVVGAVLGPALDRTGRRAYFLSLHAKGYDLRRIALDSAARGEVVSLDPRLFPVAPVVPTQRRDFASQPAAPSQPYGIGPRRWLVLPGGSGGVDGIFASLMASNGDPVGRLGLVLQGGYGDAGAWRGGSLSGVLRRWRPYLEAAVFSASHAPSKQRRADLLDRSLDARFTGGSLVAAFEVDRGDRRFAMRTGGAIGVLDGPEIHHASRRLLLLDVNGGRVLWSAGQRFLSASYAAHGSVGTTGSDSWQRGTASLGIGAGMFGVSLRGDATLGRVLNADAGLWADSANVRYEGFLVGGTRVPFFDRALLSQRVSVPAVPVGYAAGERLAVYRVSVSRIPYFTLLATPYFSWVSAGESLDDWRRVVGIEREVEFESLAFARLPTVRIRGGVGYSLDEPYRRRVGAYLSIAYRP
jgi:Tol biopolymer transport system component